METILLIEDNLELLDNTAEILELANYKVVKAENGKIGLERMKENMQNLSLILCDIMMPELDGYGVLRAYENTPEIKGVPFIFLTAKSERSDVRKGMDLGADDYLIKPFAGEELLSIISSRIKKHKSLKESGKVNVAEFEKILAAPAIFEKSEFFQNKFHIKKMLKRDSLFLEGDVSQYLYYVVKGKIKTYKTNELGKDYITNILKEGDFFAHDALLDGDKHESSAMTLENSEIAMLPKKDFLEVLALNKEFCIKFIKHISSKLSESEMKLPKLAYHSARKKLADALLFVAEKYSNGSVNNTVFSISRDDLSSITGISPESVSRNLTDFKNEGLIEVQNGELSIVDFEKLLNLKN